MFLGETVSMKAKMSLLASNVLTSVFRYASDLIHNDHLRKGSNFNSEYYENFLDTFNDSLKKNWPHLAKEKVLLRQGLLRVHTCLVIIAKFNELGFELLFHPPHFSDLAPGDYYLLPNLKLWIGGKIFPSNDETIARTNNCFKILNEKIQKGAKTSDKAYVTLWRIRWD